MKARSWRQFLAPVWMTMLAAVVGCGLGAQTPENGGQQLPFAENKPLVVAADTVIYVKLRQPITAAAQPGQRFAAVLDEPLLVDGQTVAPQGAEVAGKVAAARESGRLHTAGYVRITLTSISLNGRNVAIQTNSAIAGGGSFRNRDFSFMRGGSDRSLSRAFQSTDSSSSSASGKKEAGFDTDQRIGFRLTQALSVS